jgi:hypothetical protein
VPSIRVASFEIPDAVIAAAAVLLAAVVGVLWKKVADRPPPKS